MVNYIQALSLLKKYWGYTNFRDQQWKIISSVLSGHDCLGIMTTGAGKSLCYQILPIYAQEILSKTSICLVISPLVALMHEQVQNFNALFNSKLNWRASCITQNHREQEIWGELARGKIRLLYLSPERISITHSLERLQALPIDYICIDEAHCIMTWGQDFRPSYLNLTILKNLFPKASILALSATVPLKSRTELSNSLGLVNPILCGGNFNKDNISFSVKRCAKKLEFLHDFLQTHTIEKHRSGIIYASSRKRVMELSTELNKLNMPVAAYHAGLPDYERKFIQKQWLENLGNPPLRVLVSTNALGMGIDKPDTYFVIHDSPPASLLDYYQEAGRAGRNGQKAKAILLYEERDLQILQYRLNQDIPNMVEINQTYQAILDHLNPNYRHEFPQYYSFSLSEFLELTNLNSHLNQIEQSKVLLKHLNILEKMQLLKCKVRISNFCYIKLPFYDNNFLIHQTLGEPILEEVMEQLLRKFPPNTNPIGTLVHLERLAALTGISCEKIHGILEELEKRGLLDLYQNKGISTWLEIARPYESNLANNPTFRTILHDVRNEIYQKGAAILNYITKPPPCRNVFWAEYFNNISYSKCGICDQCRSKN